MVTVGVPLAPDTLVLSRICVEPLRSASDPPVVSPAVCVVPAVSPCSVVPPPVTCNAFTVSPPLAAIVTHSLASGFDPAVFVGVQAMSSALTVP